MTQNIYDDETFFAGYSALPRSIQGLDAAPEWLSLRALLPAMKGLRILDLGCGFGWFCRWAREAGADSVLGIDVSDRMLARARAGAKDGSVAYAKADLETIEFPPGAFDLAYSSLALHYVENLKRLAAAAQWRWRRAAGLSFPSSIRSSPRHPRRVGVRSMGARRSPSTAIWTKARARPIGWPRA